MSQADDPIEDTGRHISTAVRAVGVGMVELAHVRARRQTDAGRTEAAQLRDEAERTRVLLATAKAADVGERQANRLGPPGGRLAPPAPAPGAGVDAGPVPERA